MLHDIGYLGMFLLDPADQTLDRGVAVAEAVVFPEVLPDALSSQPLGYRGLDQFSVGFGDTPGASGRFGRFWPRAGGQVVRF
jgi:hypothetical protein